MHNRAPLADLPATARRRRATRNAGIAPTIRRAQLVDAVQICAIVNRYAAEKLLLERTIEQIALALDNYVVAVDAGGRVLACAALDEHSPSVAEIASVAVDASQQRRGLGSQVVLAAEAVARSRGFAEVFAMSLADRFFVSLDYRVVTLGEYPEKELRYEALSASGVEIVPKRCYRKVLT